MLINAIHNPQQAVEAGKASKTSKSNNQGFSGLNFLKSFMEFAAQAKQVVRGAEASASHIHDQKFVKEEYFTLEDAEKEELLDRVFQIKKLLQEKSKK